MSSSYDFSDLFVFDLANNHQGSVEHGTNVIRGVGEVAQKHGVKGALKFQFRQLDSFIHPDYREDTNNKHVSRFLSTELSRAQYQTLLDEVKKQGLLSMCTPFDEESVDVIVDMGFDILKIASCSVRDWPLVERCATAGLPIVISTGGMDLLQIDGVVAFLEHRGVDFAIMHCVSIYPIPDESFYLNRIERLRDRYPDKVIGWSTHEDPNDVVAVAMAVAKGARMFERHVGVETDEIKLNAYSSTPQQLDSWISSYRKSVLMNGPERKRPVPAVEKDSLDSLRRGVFARKNIKQGTTISRDQVFFAMPFTEGQLDSGLWPTMGQPDVRATDDIVAMTPVMLEQVERSENPDFLVLKEAIHEVKAMLNEARIALNSAFNVEYSHHYGISNFRETGAVIIECVNREYCKKLIVQLPGQRHPPHYHGLKEETFQVLHGVLHAEVDGHNHTLDPGETVLVQPGVWHHFWTDTGAIIEEISTTHHNNDSFYKDKQINQMKREQRKTVVDHWGRFQMLQ